MKKAIAALLSAVILSIPMTSFAAILAKEMPDDLYADGFDYYGIKDRDIISDYIEKANQPGYFEDADKNTFYVYVTEDMDKSRSGFKRAFNNGRAIFSIKVPQEKVSDISSDGNVTVLLQNYKQYSIYTIDSPKAAEYTESGENFCLALIKGDLGEKEYSLNTVQSADLAAVIDNKYYYRKVCAPVIHHDNEVIVAQLYDRILDEDEKEFIRDESGNFVYCDQGELAVDENGGIKLCVYKNYHKVEDYMQVVFEFDDDKCCGLKSLGLGFSDGSIYTVPAEDCMIDFDFEVKASKSHKFLNKKKVIKNGFLEGEKNIYLDEEHAIEFITEKRKTRLKNNELENILTIEDVESMLYGDDKQPEQSQPKDEPEEENKEEETKQPEEDTPEPSFPESTGEVKVNIDENELDFDGQKPVIDNDRVLVPMRKIFETLGAEVTWDAEAQTVTAQKGDAVVTLEIGKNEITKNGVTSQLDTSARILNDRTLVPIRAISESFGNDVTWNPETNTVEIKK